jgi:hypothetical protein
MPLGAPHAAWMLLATVWALLVKRIDGRRFRFRSHTDRVTDVVLIATIVAFFAAAVLLVRVLDRMIAKSADESDQDEETAEADERDLQPGGRRA